VKRGACIGMLNNHASAKLTLFYQTFSEISKIRRKNKEKSLTLGNRITLKETLRFIKSDIGNSAILVFKKPIRIEEDQGSKL